MNVVSKVNANKHEAAFISHDLDSGTFIAIAYDAEHKNINVELYVKEDTLVDFIASKTVAGAKKALQELAAEANKIHPAAIYQKLAKSQAYGDEVPHVMRRNLQNP